MIKVKQFIWGTFIFFQEWEEFDEKHEILTEWTNTSHFNNSLLEIRAFDTSYFEIYTDNQDIQRIIENIELK